MFGNALYIRKRKNNMWILTQDKESVINLDRCEYIILDDECYNEHYIGTLFKAFTPDRNYLAFGSYNEKRAAEVFEELVVSLRNGDNLFRMPEK